VPYTLDANDMRFATPQGFNTGEQFATYLTDSFDLLYAEGAAGAPKMLSIGLHCRLAGRPGRAAGLQRALDHMAAHDGVWFATRLQIAEHWAATHPPQARLRPSEMDRATFVDTSAASSNAPPGSPRPPMGWNSGPPMTARKASMPRWRARFAPPRPSGGWRCCAPIPTSPASWRRPDA
jgi:hypothetical protein